MRILAAGGGSGGHVSPVVAVLNEIAAQRPGVVDQTMFICDRAFETQARGLMSHATIPVEVRTVTAGKFRRYQHLTVLQQLMMPRLVLANVRDGFKILVGLWQSLRIIVQFRPDVVFIKGGYVCLPVGIAAHLLKVPIVVHDSDTRPGLTNSVVGRWAKAVATGSPLDNYHYKKSISRYVGVPISADFHPYSDEEQRHAKRTLGFDPARPLVVVTGGGLGAKTINQATIGASPQLIAAGIQLYHVTGKANIDQVMAAVTPDEDYQIVPFVYEGMANILGAADIVVSRASATFIQELAGLEKAAILIPSRALGDQRKNAVVYDEAHAAVVLSDDDIERPEVLASAVERLVQHPEVRQQLASALHTYAKPHAARDVADMVIKAAGTLV